MLLWGSAMAQAPVPAPVPLAQALDAAWQRSLARPELQAQGRVATAERGAADAWWAGSSSIETSLRPARGGSARETELGIALPLWLPGQRGGRAALAEAGSAEVLAAERGARLRLAGELREAAGEWALAAAEAGAGEAQLQTLAALAADVERRVRAGDLARADALAAQAERLEAEAQQADRRQRVAAARERWWLLTGVEAAPLPEASAAPAAAAVPEDHPELAWASARTLRAERAAELQRRSRAEPPELSLGVRNEGGGAAGSAANSLQLGLRWPIGSAARNAPLEAAALGELERARAVQLRTRDQLTAELAISRSALAQAQQRAAAEQQREALLRERAALIDRSFRAGETPLPELLRALAAAAQAASAAARQQAALGLAQARVQQALGMLP
jgi:cobalt-zinc-cadmium efflux system outer membrane protein